MSWLTLVIQYLPFVIKAIIAIESAVKDASGQTKKAIVMAAITAGGSVGEAIPESHIAGISKMVDSTVSLFNATNYVGFGTSAPVPIKTPITVMLTATAPI